MNRDQSGNYGTLLVAVRTGRGAFPVSGAVVAVTQKPTPPDTVANPDTVAVRITNESGIAGPFKLPAPPASASLTPSTGPSPAPQYAVYNIIVTRDGFYPYEAASEPIFSGVTAYMEINLVPLAEFESTKSFPPNTRTSDSAGANNL